MKYIRKSGTPSELIQWLKTPPNEETGEVNDLSYEAMRDDPIVYPAILSSLLEEQGFLCGYTGLRIDVDKAHIEHLKPQSLSKKNREAGIDDTDDVSYQNMVAAFPKQGRCDFGAFVKDDWYDEREFISPLDEACERRIKFTFSGKVKPVNENDTGAETTIKKLNLNNDLLVNYRKQAIKVALFHKNKPKSKGQLQTIERSYCERPSPTEKFKAFCFVIQHAASQLVKKQYN